MQNNKMKITMIANYNPQRGGISELVRALSQNLTDEGFSVHIHSVGGPLFLRPLRYFLALYFIYHADVIHSHGSSNFGFIPILIGSLAGKVFGKKTVATYHGSVENQTYIAKSKLVEISMLFVDVITTPSQFTAKGFSKFTATSVTIPNIFEGEPWKFRKRKTIWPSLVWTRGHYDPQPAIDTLLLLQKCFPEASLTLCGKYANNTYIPNAGHIKNITLLGIVPKKDIPHILDRHDIFLNTLGIDSFGYSVYEAISCGLAVVSVPSPSLTDYLGKKVITFANDNSAKALNEAVHSVLTSPKESHAKIIRGHSLVKSFSWEHLRRKWLQIYEKS